MNIHLLAIGKTRTPYMSDGIDEYEKRLKNYANFSLSFLPNLKGSASRSEEQIVKLESTMLSAELQPQDSVILLDKTGTEYSSEGFAKFLQAQMNSSRKRIVFVIGGAFGFDEEMHKRANSSMRLSAMTLTHEMVRLLFVEQLYRAFTILKGEKYHHA